MEERGAFGELLWLASIASSIKLLLVPSYYSTDFEVHRNWLAITHTLPVNKWYVDETSEWTLDYPPFFAWFERLLSVFAAAIDPKIVELSSGSYSSPTCVLFQRATVMVADLVLYLGLYFCCRGMAADKRRLVYMAVVFSPGLLMVDHVHFQYNGFLLGVLLLSLAALRSGRDLLGGFIFAVLVCFKHLFAVAGPVYFVYLLRHYCVGPRKFRRFFTLAATVVAVVVLAFAPFIYYNQMDVVLRRLFPFGRGLSHAYWAPNLWALYNTTDKLLSLLLKAAGFQVISPTAAYTSGLVGDSSSFSVLPQITPLITFSLVFLSLLPSLRSIWKQPRPSQVLNHITYAYMCGFIFGWHVHEKASLHFVIPLALVSADTNNVAGDYLFLSTVCYYSLFPLLFQPREYPLKVLLLVLYFAVMWSGFSSHFNADEPQKKKKKKKGRSEGPLLGKLKWGYLAGIILVEVYGQFGHSFMFQDRLPFLPLMLVSAYCSIGVGSMWLQWFFSGLPGFNERRR